jgi:hypothetical protein
VKRWTAAVGAAQSGWRLSEVRPPQPPADVQAAEYEDGDDDQADEHGLLPSVPRGITGRRRRVLPGFCPQPTLETENWQSHSSIASLAFVENWTLLTSHAQVLLAIAHDPGIRLRDIAATVGITERSAYAIVTDLTEAGYVAKRKDGRRNRYQIQAHLPLPGPASTHATIGELLSLLTSRAEATEHS